MDPLQTDKELQEAIRAVSEHLGVPSEAPTKTAPDERPGFDLFGLPWVAGTGILLLAVILTGTALLDRRDQVPDPAGVEADLRWSVAHVVTEVERLRSTLGRLPEASDLPGILSEAVVYRPDDGTYVVTGERAGVRVEYDGRLPLEVWQALQLYGEVR